MASSVRRSVEAEIATRARTATGITSSTPYGKSSGASVSKSSDASVTSIGRVGSWRMVDRTEDGPRTLTVIGSGTTLPTAWPAAGSPTSTVAISKVLVFGRSSTNSTVGGAVDRRSRPAGKPSSGTGSRSTACDPAAKPLVSTSRRSGSRWAFCTEARVPRTATLATGGNGSSARSSFGRTQEMGT
jgi:hypothetical protein